jgi:hypothetical protein
MFVAVRYLLAITGTFADKNPDQSIFGMNIDAFRGALQLKWFFVSSVALMMVVLGLWWGFRIANGSRRGARGRSGRDHED